MISAEGDLNTIALRYINGVLCTLTPMDCVVGHLL